MRPQQAVPFLREKLSPVTVEETRRITRRVADLDSDRFADREDASRELLRLGLAAQPALRRVLEGRPSLEVRKRVERLLRDLETRPHPEALRPLRALVVLEAVGTPEARQVLQTLAEGAPDAHWTEEARAALERLRRR
jgi:hypothetical protein